MGYSNERVHGCPFSWVDEGTVHAAMSGRCQLCMAQGAVFVVFLLWQAEHFEADFLDSSS